MTQMSRMDFLTGVRRGGRPTIGCSIRDGGSGSHATPYPFVYVFSGQTVVKFTSVLGEEAAWIYGCFSLHSFRKAGSPRKASHSDRALKCRVLESLL
jgi:hypothetical protein